MATQSFIGRQADLFHKWLSVQTLERPVSELCAMLPLVNDYGKTHNVLQESIFELTESEQVLRLLSIIQADKRFIIVHRGHLKQIRLVIQKYCEFIEESKKNSASKMYSEQTEINQGFSVETAPGSRVLASKSQYAKKSSLCLKTKKGVEYYGETPAELLASLCDELAENHPAVMRKLIGVPYYGQGSVVLLPEEPDQGGIKLYNVNCYIDIRLGNDAVINYGKWICKQCSEPDMPERISSENNSVAETESSEVKPVSTIDNVNQLYSSKTPEKDEVSQEVSRATGEVSLELETDDSKETSKGKPVVIETATRAWSKYEVALLIETYLKTSENGYFRAAAEVLSHKLRDLAIKQGKAVDSTYRNVNGIMMQLGTVQYCFTNGKKGLSNASVQIREMVDMYKNHFTEYDKLLQDAHKTLGEEENEIAKFLQLEDYDVLRNELLKQGITSISQLKALDLWSFMNRYGLYSIRKRQEIFNNINELLKSSNDNGKDRKKYYIKTQRGLRYYGSTPADAFASYCEKLVQEYPLMIRKAIGLCYDATGRVVLWPGKLSSGSIKISNLNAYIDGDLSDQRVIQYGVWLCRRFGEKDEPVELCVSTEKQSASSLVKTQAVNHVPEEKKEINVQVTSEQSSKGNIEYKVEQQVELEGWDALVGDAWLFKMLSDKKIQYEDKRENQGCLWISGGHELDTFIDLCKGKGYRFHYKADGYKAFNKGPAWWTTDSVISDTLTEAQSSSLDASASKKKTNEIWSVEGDQLQFMNFHFIVPEEFDVLYKEKCSDSIVAFYPRRDKSFSTLAISKLDQSIHDKNEVRKRFRDKVSYYLANEPNAKEEFSKTDETNTILAILSMISYTGSEGRNRIYKSYLYHKFREDFCSLQIAVDGNDERAIDYDEVFKKLIESALKWKRVKQSADTPVSNDQKQIPVLDSLVSEKDADSQQSIEVVESEKQDTSDSTVVFRRWLEQSFRSYMVQFKGLSAKTVSQYCQSIEAVEQFIRKRNLPMTLVSVEAKAAQNVFDKLSLRSDFKDWNMTIDQVTAILNEEHKAGQPMRFPCRAVMVDNVEQYVKLLSRLKEIPGIEVVQSADLFSSADVMPKYENLIKLLADGKWRILPGVSEYLRLFSRVEAESQRFAKLWSYIAPTSNMGRIIIPLWGCTAQWHDKSLHLTEDIRKEDFYYDCTEDFSAEQKMDLVVLSEEFQSYANQLASQDGQLFYGLKEWYEYWTAPVSGIQYQVLLTGRYNRIQPATGSIAIRVIKDTLSFVSENIKGGSVLTAENCPAEAQSLLVEYAVSGADLETAILTVLNVEAFNAMDIMARWKSLSDGQKQLVILWIKLHPDGSYLYHCVQQSDSIHALNEPILYSIFTTSHNTEKWVEESQKLVSVMGINRDEVFLEQLDKIPTYEERLQYLTGNSSEERTYLLHMVGQWLRLDASQVQGNLMLRNLYPALMAYLDGSCYDDELRRYMMLYKTHKLENSLPDDEELYFAGIQTEVYDYRFKVLSEAIDENSVVLWIDALGVEWLPLLLWELKADGKGIIKGSHVALANLPTETMYNDQWNQMSVPHEKLDKLDKLAHKGVIDNVDYYACVEQQLQFMNTVVSIVRKLFKDYQRVIITGDHGTSRLAARFFHKRQGIPAPQTGKVCSHGRYCEVQNDPAFYAHDQKLVKNQDGQKFVVFTNYDHFVQPGFAAGAEDEKAIYGEVHGGGTPEEVLVPVIVIDSKESIPLKAKWTKNPVKIQMKKAKTAISFNRPVSDLKVKAGLFMAECSVGENAKEWQVVFPGIKPENYAAAVVADGKIVEIDELSVISALGGDEVGDLP